MADEMNLVKEIITRSGIVIRFDDGDKTLTVTTPAQNTISLSDPDRQITIQDQHNNSIVMSVNGISIKSSKDINIEAAEKVNIKGSVGVQINAPGGDVVTSGLNIKETAAVGYSAQGSASAEMTATGQLSLKGGLVMIN